MPVDNSPTEAFEFLGNASTPLGVMALLVTIVVIGLVCCKKRKPKADAHMTAGNEGHYTKRGTKIITDDTFAHNNVVTIQMKDLPVVKYDKALDLDDNTSQGEPPLNVSVSSKTRLVVVEDDSDYAVIGHDAGAVAEVIKITASVTAGTSEGDNFHIVEIETFDEINYEDDYSTIEDELHKASERKSVSEPESNKANDRRSQVDSRSSKADGNVDLQVQETKVVDDYATIVPKSLRIENQAHVKRKLFEIDDIDRPGHDVMGWPHGATFENSRTDMPELLHITDPNLIKQSQNHFPENTKETPTSYNTSLKSPGQNDPMGSALKKLCALLDDIPSDMEESNRSLPSGQAGHTLMEASVPPPGLSSPSTDMDRSPLQPHRLFKLSM